MSNLKSYVKLTREYIKLQEIVDLEEIYPAIEDAVIDQLDYYWRGLTEEEKNQLRTTPDWLINEEIEF